MKYLNNIDLTKNQLLNTVIQNLASAPESPVEGLIYHNTTDHYFYYYNGTAWVKLQAQYVHPNHSGDVTSVADGAQTIANSAVTYAKMQNVSATDKLLGRSTAGAGVIEEIACTSAGRALLDDASAEVQRSTLGLGTMATATATDYVAKALFDAHTVIAATADDTPAAVTVAEDTIVGRKTGGNITALTAAEVLTILGISSTLAKYSETIGNGADTDIVVTHSLGTRDITVAVYRVASPYDVVYPDIEHTSTSTITLGFSVAPTEDQYRVVVIG